VRGAEPVFASAPDVPRGSVSAAPTTHTGALRVETRPAGARVIVDGSAAGLTPLVLDRLASGDHRVRIEQGGYRAVLSTVKVVGGEETRLAVTMELLSGSRRQ
jgi:hypothetical protein